MVVVTLALEFFLPQAIQVTTIVVLETVINFAVKNSLLSVNNLK